MEAAGDEDHADGTPLLQDDQDQFGVAPNHSAVGEDGDCAEHAEHDGGNAVIAKQDVGVHDGQGSGAECAVHDFEIVDDLATLLKPVIASPQQHPGQIGGDVGDPLLLLDERYPPHAMVLNRRTQRVGLVPSSSISRTAKDPVHDLVHEASASASEVESNETLMADLSSDVKKKAMLEMTQLLSKEGALFKLIEWLQPAWFSSLVAYFHTPAADRCRSFGLTGVRKLCQETKRFMSLCYTLISCVEARAIVRIDTSTARLHVFLIGVHVLLRLPHPDWFSGLADAVEFKELVTDMNWHALSTLRPDVASTILADIPLLRSLAECVYSPTRTMITNLLAENCSHDNMFLLVCMMLVEGCLRSVNSSPFGVDLGWNQVACRLKLRSLSIPPTCFMHTLCDFFRNDFFCNFTTELPVDEIMKNIFNFSRSTVELDVVAIAKAVWPLVHYSKPKPRVINSVVEMLSKALGRTSADGVQEEVEQCASLYLGPDDLARLLSLNHRVINVSTLRRLYTGVDGVTHERREAALESIQKIVFDTFYEAPKLDSDPLDSIITAMSSADADSRWQSTCMAISIVHGQEIGRFRLRWCSTARMVDLLERTEHAETIKKSLAATIKNLHMALGCEALLTASTIMESVFLRDSCLIGSLDVQPRFSLQSVLTTREHIIYAIDTLNDLQNPDVRKDFPLDMFTTETNCMVMFWSFYCASLLETCKRFPSASIDDVLCELHDRLETIVEQMDGVPCMSGFAGAMASTVMAIFQLREPAIKHVPNDAVLLLLRMCTRAEAVHKKGGVSMPFQLEAFQAYKARVQRTAAHYRSGEYSRVDYDEYVQHNKNLSAICCALDLDTVDNLDSFRQLDQQCERRIALLSWQHLKPAKGSQQLLKELEGVKQNPAEHLCNIRQLLQRVDAEFLQRLAFPVGSVEYNCPAHEYITETIKKSVLCSRLSDVTFSMYPVELYPDWTSSVGSILSQIFEQVENLLSPLTQYQCLSRIIDGIVTSSPAGYDSFLACLDDETEVFRQSPPHSANVSGIERLDRLLWYRAWKACGVKGVIKALRLSSKKSDDVLEAWVWQSNQHDPPSDSPLRSASSSSHKLMQLTQQFSLHHLKFFYLVQEDLLGGLFGFFKELHFTMSSSLRQRFQLLNIRLEGDPLADKLMTSLYAVENIVSPFFLDLTPCDVLEEFRHSKFDSRSVYEAARNLAAVRRLLDSVISNAFDDAKSVLLGLGDPSKATVEIHLDTSEHYQYVCKFERLDGARDHHTMAETRQFQLCLPYLRSLEEPTSRIATTLSDSFGLLEKLMAKVLELEGNGHFAFLKKVEDVPVPISQSCLETLLLQYTEELTQWKARLPLAKEKCPVLNMFSNYSIGSMARLVARCSDANVSAKEVRCLVSSLLWHVLSAVPLAVPNAGSLTCTTIRDALESSEAGGPDPLEQLGLLLSQVVQLKSASPAAASLPGVHHTKQVRQTLYTVEGCNSDRDSALALSSLLCEEFRGTTLSRAQFLFCTPLTSQDDLRSFCRAAESTGARFAMCGIDMLSGSCRSTLLELQLELGKRLSNITLIYLCYRKVFAQAWPEVSGVKRKALSSAPFSSLQSCFISCGNLANGGNRFNLKIIPVCGPAGAGKSFWTKEKCEVDDSQPPVVVDLAQLDGADDACQLLVAEYQKGNLQRDRNLHLRIPSNADVVLINRVFFELLWCGAIRAQNKKKVFAVAASSNKTWKWFVEVQEDILEAENGHQHDLRAISEVLPFLSVATSSCPIDFKLRKIILQEEQRKLARLLDRFFKATDTGLIDLDDDTQPSDSECSALIHQLLSLDDEREKTRLEEILLLQYLYVKWKFIVTRTDLPSLARSYPRLTSAIVALLIKEAIFMSSRDLQCVFQRCPQGFLVCDPFSVMASSAAQADVYKMAVIRSTYEDEPDRQWSPYPISQSRNYQLGLLSWMFGIEDGEVDMLIKQHEFVLTADFAFKLFLIHERQRLGRPLVLESETGAGKTYLLQMYSKLSEYAIEKRTKLQRFKMALQLLKSIIFNPQHWDTLGDEGQCKFPRLGQPADEEPSSIILGQDVKLHSVNFERLPWVWSEFLALLKDELRPTAKHLLQLGLQSCITDISVLDVNTDLRRLLAVDSLTDAESEKLLHELVATRPKNLFRKMLVHPGLLKSEIKRFLDEVLTLARSTPGHVIIVFFDEFNTSKYIDSFKEIMFDNTFGGAMFPKSSKQLFFVAAVNPFGTKERRWNMNYFTFDPHDSPDTMKEWDDEMGQVYNVRCGLPKIMSLHRWKYFSLREPEELEEYTACKIEFLKDSPELRHVNARNEFNDDVLMILSKFLYHSYCFCQENVTRCFVSQRDVQRVFKLIPHLWNLAINELMETRREIDVNSLLLRCIPVSIALVFYVRLPTIPTDEYPNASRNLLDCYVTKKVQEGYPRTGFASNSLKRALETEIKKAVTHENFYIPDGVALTPALQENIFCMVACIQQRIPLGIIGEPGSSKTLAYQIVRQNLCGERGSTKKFCQQFGAVDPFFCQCSPESSTDQIQRLFNVAIKRQRFYDKQQLPAYTALLTDKRPKVTVFIDEAGLLNVRQNRMVMKVLHPYLDEPEVSFVTMSNHWFDAANTNRMLTVFRSRADNDDLTSLAYGCLGLPDDGEVDNTTRFLHGLCEGYRSVAKRFPDWYHQRDLIALLRFFRRHTEGVRRVNVINIQQDHVLQGIEETFGGRCEKDVRWVVNTFFEKIHKSLPSFPECAQDSQFKNPIEILLRMRYQLQIAHEEGKLHYLNTSAMVPRFLLLVDDYGCDFNTVDMLFRLGVVSAEPGQTHLFQHCSQVQESSDVQCASILAQLRQFLNQPCTVVIVNSPRLHGYLYELFNKNYLMLQEKGKRCAFSNIAMGDGTFPCQIHPNFQCIVILSREIATRERTPFLSRFSKHTLHPCQGWEYVLRNTDADRLLRSVQKQCELFTTQMNAHYFFGAGSDSTAAPGKVVIEEGTPRMSSSAAADQLQWSSMFSGTLFLHFLNLLKSSGNGRFSVHDRGQAPAGDFVRLATRRIVASYFQLMPLESYISSCQLLTPPSAYHKFFVESRQNSFTLRAILENTLRTTEHSRDKTAKLMLLTKSTSSDVQRLTRSSDLRERCLGRTLSEMTEIHILSKFQHFSELRQAMEEFSRGPMACTVFSVDVSQPSQKSAIGPLKRLIDDHCTQLRRNGIKQTKLFVILLDVLLKNPLHKDACGAMLNGWKSYFVSVDSLSSCCPISIPEFLSFTKWSGSWEPPGRQNHVSRLKPLLEKHVDLFCDHFCRSLHDVRMSNAHLEMLPASVRPLFAPISASSPSHSEVRLKALKWVIETVPGIFAWLANALISWLIEEGSEWAEKFSKQIIKQDIYVSLEDLIFVETDAALKDLMQTLLLALLSDYNLHNVLQLVEQKCLVEKLLMLVPARRVDLATDGRLFHGNRHLYTTPFFQEFITHVNAAVSTERETLGAVHEGMMKSVVVRPLLDMRAFLELCVVDSLVYKFDWKKPRLTLEVAARVVQLNYTEQMAFGVEGPPDLFSFTHVHIRKDRQLLLSALHGSNALLKLIGREACAEEVHQLVGDTNPALQPRDLLHRLGCVLVEKLWSELNKILCSGSYEPDKLLPQLLRWKKTVDYAFQYWPFHCLQSSKSSQGQGAKQPVDAVPESSTGQVKLVVAANLVLSSLTSTNPHPLLKVLRTLIPDDSARDVSLDKILDRLLSQHEEIHLPSEIVQLKYGCGEWLVQRLMLQTFSTVGECVNDHDFELLLTCIHGSSAILRFDHCYMPAKSGAALLAKIEDKLVKDLNCPRSRVQHGMEQAISKWIGEQKSAITQTFTPGHLPSGTSWRAKRKEPVMPLEQAFYELAYMWRRQIRLPNLDAFEHHVNAACDDSMNVRRDFRREMQGTTPLSTLSIQEMAKKRIAIEVAAARIREYAQRTHRQGSIAGQQGFPDAQQMAKLFAAIEEESAFLDLFTWKIATTINCLTAQDAISGIGDKWAVTLSERCRPLVPLQYSNSLLSNSINTAECEILPCLVQRKNFAGPRQDLNSSLKISGLPKTLHLLAQQDGSSSYFRRMEACLVWKAFNEDFKLNRIGIQTMYSKLAPGGNLEGVYRLLFSNSGPICEEFWDMIGGNGSAAEYHMLEEMYVSTLVAIISMGPNCHLHTCVYCPDILRGSYIFGSLSSHGKQLGQAEAQSSIIDGFLRTCMPNDAHGLAWPVMAFEARKRPSRLSVLGAMLSSLLTCIALCWHTVLFPTATDNVIADQDHDQGLSPADARSLLTKRCLAAARSLFNEMSRAELNMSPLSMKSYILTALQCMVEHANNPTGPTFRASYINLPQLEEMEAAFQRDVVETALETHCATLNRYLTRSLGESFAALHWAQLRSQYNCQRDVWYAAHADNPILAHVVAYHPRLQLVRRLLSIMKFFVDIHAFGSRQFCLADVITNTLSVKDAIDLIGGQAGRLLQETFEQAKVDYNIISKAISRMPMEVVGPWQHSPIIDTTPLKDLVNIHSPQTQGSRLNRLITLVLSWQTALYTLCSRHSEVARSPLDMYLAQNLHAEAVMPADVIAHNGAELLEMSSDDLEQLLRVHCQHDQKSQHLVMNIDADTMEIQVVTRHISRMRRISWDSYSSATHFFFQDEDGFVFSVTPSSPIEKTDLRQDIELEHVLFNISNAQVTVTLLELRRLMRDIKQQNWPDDGQRHKQSLDQYMEHARKSHSVEYPNLQAFGCFIRLENLGALQLALERRQHRNEFTQIPRSLAHAMRGEDQKTILEQLEELVHASGDLARSVEFLKRFRDALLTVQRQVEKQPSLSLLTLLTQDVGTESTENSLDESVLHSILPVGVLGLHLKQLVIMVSSFLKEVTAKQLEQEILSKTPRDPCCLEVVRRPSAADELAISLVMEVVGLNDTTRPVKRVVTAPRSDSVLHVINQVLQRLNCTQTMATYGMGGKLFQHSKDQKIDVLARRHAQTNSNGELTVTVYLQEKEEEDD
eukprot:scpid610/ scgid14919/ Putative uncharacterized transmembrane protein DDB_G0290641